MYACEFRIFATPVESRKRGCQEDDYFLVIFEKRVFVRTTCVSGWSVRSAPLTEAVLTKQVRSNFNSAQTVHD